METGVLGDLGQDGDRGIARFCAGGKGSIRAGFGQWGIGNENS
jgi:hypothetical protein